LVANIEEERRLKASEKSLLRRIFWPRRDEVIGDCRKLHNEEINDLHFSNQYFSSDKIDKNEMGGA